MPAIVCAVVLGIAWLVAACARTERAQEDTRKPTPDTVAFYGWWDSMIVSPKPMAFPSAVRRQAARLLEWPAAPPELVPPAHVRAQRTKGFVLTERGGRRLVLWVPTDSAEASLRMPACGANVAWLSLEGAAAGAAVPLNPYCNEVYGPEEVDVALYTLGDGEWPLVEVVTNHPAHVPFYLYRFDPARGAFALSREGRGG